MTFEVGRGRELEEREKRKGKGRIEGDGKMRINGVMGLRIYSFTFHFFKISNIAEL